MEAEELRLGNKVGYKGDAGVYHVLGFPEWVKEQERTVIIDRCPKEICSIDKIKSIPLTEEWLTKFGFYQFKNANFKQRKWTNDINSFYLLKNYGGWEIGYAWKLIRGFYKKNPLQVHQLQNLYFALTGEELNTK